MTLWFETLQQIHIPFSPPSHQRFVLSEKAEVSNPSAFCHEATLVLEQSALSSREEWEEILCRNEIWELWKNKENEYVFSNPRQEIKRQISIAPDFQKGVIKGDFISAVQTAPVILPQDLEIVFFVNWLANYGDVLLHASGIALDGKGYVFAGASGVGKSTLAATLSTNPSVTILGEDQVMLRWTGEEFRVFGTPWHVNPELCNPMGVPLAQIHFLERKNSCEKSCLSAAEGVLRLLQTAFIPYYRTDSLELILSRLSMLAERVPFYTLSYRLGMDILDFISVNS